MTRLLILLVTLLSGSVALASPAHSEALKAQLEQAIRQHCNLTSQATVDVDQVRVSNATVLNDASALKRVELPQGEDGVGRVAARALFASGDGSESWTWVQARVETRVPTLVATTPLKRGDVLDSTQLKRALRPVHPDGVAPLTELVGKALTRSIRAGDAVRAHMVRATSMVSRGDVVSAELRGKTFVVRTTAEAAQKGRLGDVIRVRVMPHRRVMKARILGRGVVEVLR